MEELFGDQRLFQLYQYWQSKKVGGQAVRRADVDLSEIPTLLPILQILDVDGAPPCFRHRFVGTDVVEAMGRDVTGQFVGADLYGEATEEIVKSLEETVREARAFRRTAHLQWHDRDWLEIEAVELPVVDDEGSVIALVCGAIFRRHEPGPRPRLVHEPLPAALSEKQAPATPD